MSTSDKSNKRQKARKAVVTYAGITLFCGLFSFVYEQFSHGVYSSYMICLFLFPLLGGVLPYALLGLVNNLRFPSRASMNLYNFGIATLTVGSCLKGVLDIYGTTSDYMPVYWIAGAVLIALGIVVYILSTMIQDLNVMIIN